MGSRSHTSATNLGHPESSHKRRFIEQDSASVARLDSEAGRKRVRPESKDNQSHPPRSNGADRLSPRARDDYCPDSEDERCHDSSAVKDARSRMEAEPSYGRNTVDMELEDHQLQAALEELSQARAELKFLEERSRSQDNIRDGYLKENEQLREALRQKDGMIASLGEDNFQLKDKYNVLRDKHIDVVRRHNDNVQRLNHMICEEPELQQEIKDLRKREHARLHEPEKSLLLGAFDNTVDQVSEAQVKSHGRVSVDGINDSVDTIVLDFSERIAVVVDAYHIHHPTRSACDIPPPDLEPLFRDAFCSLTLSEDSRGLLLDAAIHHIVVQALHSMCFKGKVSTYCLDSTTILEQVYKEIAASEPWSASQRWRSMSASTFMKLLGPSAWDRYVNSASQQIITTTAWAYGMPVSAFQSLKPSLEKNIAGAFQSAHELSVVLKRDILSARLSVVVGPKPKSRIDSSQTQRVWPEMKSERQDRVLGYYGLGLQVERREGEKHFLTLPMVITESLTREVKRKDR